MARRRERTDVNGERPPTRRAYLRAAGVTAAVGALAGCGGDPDPETTTGRPTETTTKTTTTETETARTTRTVEETTDRPPETTTRPVNPSDYETVVNVADAGGDTSGETPVDSILNERAADDTLLYFPPGRYLVEEWKATGYRNLAAVGDDAALVPPDGEQNYWLMFGDLREFRFSGFTIDCRGRKVSPITYLSVTGGTSVVRDVTVRGRRRAPTTAFEVAAADPDAALRFENVALPDGSTNGHAVFVFPESVGRLTFRNCRVEHWKEGLYAAYHSGPLEVLGGYYANNGIEQVRVGGGKAGAVVRGVTVRVDGPRHPQTKPNMRGIWAEEGGRARIENCDVAITDLTGTYSSGAIVVGKQFGEVLVRNTRIRTDVGTNAISVRNPIDSLAGQRVPSMGSLPDSTRFTARNVRVVGDAKSGTAVRANRRDNCVFEQVCIRQPRGSRDGIRFFDAEGCAVRDSTIAVSGEAIRNENATVVTDGVRTDGRC